VRSVQKRYNADAPNTNLFGMDAVPTHHRIITGDSRCMAEVPDESVHLVATSPPYWQLKDYGNGRQIGFDGSQKMQAMVLGVTCAEGRRNE